MKLRNGITWPILKDMSWLYIELCEYVIHLHVKNVDGFDFAPLTFKQMTTALETSLVFWAAFFPFPKLSLVQIGWVTDLTYK